MNAIEKLLNIAFQEEGYCEKSASAFKSDPSILYDKTKGAGIDNITLFAKELVSEIGAPFTQGAAWCQSYVSYCFLKAFGKDIAKSMIGGWTAYTPTAAQNYMTMGRWSKNPQVGSQIFFQNNIRINHTGIVYKVDSTKVYTIEGNTSSGNDITPNGGCVVKKSYLKSNTRIAGYGLPMYELAPKSNLYLYKGLDVSAAQKKMDYSKLKESGIDFAIIKVIRKDLNKDDMFETHYNGFTKVGVPVFCVYNYSYATTIEKACSDARMVLKHLEGRKLAVCLDIEDKCQQGLEKALIDIINAYQAIIESSGLPFILYSGMYFYNSYIKPYDANLKCKNIWLARYYKGDTPMFFNEDPDNSKKPADNIIGWQYTSKGQISGYNGNLDFDIIYKDIKVPESAKQIVTKVTTKGSRLNVRKVPVNGAIVDKLTNGTQIYIIDIQDGWCKLDKDKFVSGQYVSTNTYGTITANSLNIRNSDSTKGIILGQYHKGELVPILNQSSTGWYLTPKGWISNKYVTLS